MRSRVQMAERLAQLEAQREAISEEMTRLRAALKEERLAPTGTFGGDRASRTQPYIVAQPDRSESVDVFGTWGDSSPRTNTAPTPRIGAPQMPLASDLAEPMADFDPGALRSVSEEALDALPYGLVIVDRQGQVLRYNDTESRMVGLPADQVVGLNFFRDIAPCTRVRAFEGRFLEFAASARTYSVESFDFVFRFRKETQHVTIYLTPGRQRGTFNIAMLRRKVVPNR